MDNDPFHDAPDHGEQRYTNLFARVIEEDDGYTVQVKLTNHAELERSAWGEEIADFPRNGVCNDCSPCRRVLYSARQDQYPDKDAKGDGRYAPLAPSLGARHCVQAVMRLWVLLLAALATVVSLGGAVEWLGNRYESGVLGPDAAGFFVAGSLRLGSKPAHKPQSLQRKVNTAYDRPRHETPLSADPDQTVTL